MLSSLLTLRDIHELLIEFFIKNDKKAYHGHVNSILFLKTERHHRCESTIIGLVVDWKRAKDNKLSVSFLSTDMSKASVWWSFASELLVRSPMSCTNRDGKKLLEASKSWLPSGVGLMAASPEHLSE